MRNGYDFDDGLADLQSVTRGEILLAQIKIYK